MRTYWNLFKQALLVGQITQQNAGGADILVEITVFTPVQRRLGHDSIQMFAKVGTRKSNKQKHLTINMTQAPLC